MKPCAIVGKRASTAWLIEQAPRADSRRRKEFDARQTLANRAGVDLKRINGRGLAAVMKILTDIGRNLSRFANVKHFCSWLGLCPGTKISGGKVLLAKTKRSADRARQALKMAAMSLSRSGSALGGTWVMNTHWQQRHFGPDILVPQRQKSMHGVIL
jgi:transposase